MESLRNSLEYGFRSHGHFNISITYKGNKLSTVTTNTLAIDSAFDDEIEDGAYYESNEEAQDALIQEILIANDIEF